MAMENDGMLSETLEQIGGLDGQGCGADGETPAPEMLLPAPEPEDPYLPQEKDAEDGFTPLTAENGGSAESAATGAPPAEGHGGADDAPDTSVEEPTTEGAESGETATAKEKPKRKRAAPRKKAAPKEEAPPPEDEMPVKEQETQDQEDRKSVV